MISLILGVLLLGVFSLISLSFLSDQIRTFRSAGAQPTSVNGNPDNSQNSASNQTLSIKEQIDLRSAQTALTIYFSENETYPFSLDELVSQGYLNELGSGISYRRCSNVSATLTASSGSGIYLEYTEAKAFSSSSKLGC
jgi:hypothetical protein